LIKNLMRKKFFYFLFYGGVEKIVGKAYCHFVCTDGNLKKIALCLSCFAKRRFSIDRLCLCLMTKKINIFLIKGFIRTIKY